MACLLLVGLWLPAPAAAQGSTPTDCFDCPQRARPSVGAAGDRFNGEVVVGNKAGRPVTDGPPGRGQSCPGCSTEIVPVCGSAADFCPAEAYACAADGDGVLSFVFVTRPPAPRRLSGTICLRPGEEPVSVADVTAAVRTYLDSLVPTDPRVVVQPPGGALVNVPTLVHADMPTGPVTETFFPLGLSVQVTARPVRWTWTFEPGVEQAYAHPGAPYEPGVDLERSGRHTTHTYETAGLRQVQVVVTWTASFTAAGFGTVDVGEVQRPSQPVAVDVLAARSELVA